MIDLVRPGYKDMQFTELVKFDPPKIPWSTENNFPILAVNLSNSINGNLLLQMLKQYSFASL